MKKIMIIGATSGMGRSLAERYLETGHQVALVGRRVFQLELLADKFPDQSTVLKFDIKDTSSFPAFFENAVHHLGGLDLLVLTAGMGEINESLLYKIESDTIFTNVLGFTAVVNVAYHYFERKGSGQLAVISSISGLRGNKSAPAYNATKAFQINYLESLRHKSHSVKCISITDIRPGFVDTAMARGKGIFWMAELGKATDQIYRAIEKEKKVAYLSRRWHLIGILLKIMPRSIYERL